ncbi:hypothetical protein L917_01346 [Phytophthora nicotianae]|uniref:Uncharacterized protein n=1 Tax=Phytophthora nicotianae TaxID=4792 RepID=W2JTI6_PHYNI|nr:hypothetical protein L916_01370 [Phytophthora nicotianae]ETM02136.1 hypothetical protein L917_01346 [Phytophthora nicotianae]
MRSSFTLSTPGGQMKMLEYFGPREVEHEQP